MSQLKLTPTRMRDGVWHGIITTDGGAAPDVRVVHLDAEVPGVALAASDVRPGEWHLSVPVPPEAISDGVQTLIICDAAQNDAAIGHVTLIAGDAIGEDLRAEVALLRAELDMLKRAFRRHCVESS